MQTYKDIFYIDWSKNKAAILRSTRHVCYLHPIQDFDIVLESDLVGLEKEIATLDSNTLAFLSGKQASNALLWGARGCGKSSVVKAVLGKYLATSNLRIVEIESKDIEMLPIVLDFLREYEEYYFIVFCDDLAFSSNDYSYRSVKSVLEGSFEKHPSNVLLYATSNMRHIVQEELGMNALHSQDVIHENLSFSDRFPLNIGFYMFGTKEYFAVLESFITKSYEKAKIPQAAIMAHNLLESIKQEALNFATQVGNRSPRTARNFWNLYQNTRNPVILENQTKDGAKTQ
ncbi:DUF815 domain-containing protein [Helicobacter sp. MIT 14-3879]|uniref:DUF815 domain-containing protein n=1 Tax=Helicobacter sp. MIT 14-3879 TaxID=2040649 RepID=UPI000E1E55D0|nr:DUF815 domain-containing protein [Helicobacter sp. MIT 14-3879]RDU59243.1 hypothetical protein CQA44_11610 [Helicobacter sp. MIT 14-3879]